MGVPTFLETGHMTEGFPIRVIHTGEQFNFAAHWHEEVELVVVNGERARIGVNNEVYELVQGDVLLIKPGMCTAFARYREFNHYPVSAGVGNGKCGSRS